jgi:hypothetical protein
MQRASHRVVYNQTFRQLASVMGTIGAYGEKFPTLVHQQNLVVLKFARKRLPIANGGDRHPLGEIDSVVTVACI